MVQWLLTFPLLAYSAPYLSNSFIWEVELFSSDKINVLLQIHG